MDTPLETAKKIVRPVKCAKCGQSLDRLMILALMCDLGARAYPSPDRCPTDGGDHDFSEPKES